jgi:hypothetical protein
MLEVVYLALEPKLDHFLPTAGAQRSQVSPERVIPDGIFDNLIPAWCPTDGHDPGFSDRRIDMERHNTKTQDTTRTPQPPGDPIKIYVCTRFPQPHRSPPGASLPNPWARVCNLVGPGLQPGHYAPLSHPAPLTTPSQTTPTAGEPAAEKVHPFFEGKCQPPFDQFP